MTNKEKQKMAGRKLTISWDELETLLKEAEVLMENDKTKEYIEQVTLVKPRTLLIQTREK